MLKCTAVSLFGGVTMDSPAVSFLSTFHKPFGLQWQREEELTALSCGAGEDCYEYHGLPDELTNRLLKKLKLRNINKETATIIFRTYHAKRKYFGKVNNAGNRWRYKKERQTTSTLAR